MTVFHACSYKLQKREEERKDSEDSKQDTRIVQSIHDVKHVTLSCEKKIQEFKVSNIMVSHLRIVRLPFHGSSA